MTNEENVGEVCLSYEQDNVTRRHQIVIWGTSSTLPGDLSVDEWKALCAAIKEGGESIVDLTELGSRTVIPVVDEI